MSDDTNYNDYFSTFKVGNLGKGRDGNLQEYTKEDLKNAKAEDFRNEVFYADGSDFMANMGFVVTFLHEPSQEHVHFKAFINSFNETFNSDWDSQAVYGRTDPIKMFKQTSRSITVSLVVPAASEAEAFENLSRIQKLTSYLYPTYEKIDNALTVSQSPLVRMKIMNMVTNNSADKTTGTYSNIKKLGAKNLSKAGAQQGLLGNIRNLSINHNIDNPDMGSFHVGSGAIFPRAIEVTLDFDVIHEKTLGWTRNKGRQNFSDKTFPYGVNWEGSNPNTKEELEDDMNKRIAASILARQDQIREEEERELSEQMLQNAIAAGHVVADGIVNGQTQFKLSNKGERAKNRLGKRDAATKKTWWNPFDAKPYPDDATEAAGDAYQKFLTEGNFNDFL